MSSGEERSERNHAARPDTQALDRAELQASVAPQKTLGPGLRRGDDVLSGVTTYYLAAQADVPDASLEDAPDVLDVFL